jgi:hypothetical protein
VPILGKFVFVTEGILIHLISLNVKEHMELFTIDTESVQYSGVCTGLV